MVSSRSTIDWNPTGNVFSKLRLYWGEFIKYLSLFVAVSVFAVILVEFDKHWEGNPNKNLMMLSSRGQTCVYQVDNLELFSFILFSWSFCLEFVLDWGFSVRMLWILGFMMLFCSVNYIVRTHGDIYEDSSLQIGVYTGFNLQKLIYLSIFLFV